MTIDIINKIKDSLQLEIVSDQHFDWGEQYWLQLEPDSSGIQPTVSVAIVYPGAWQQSHVHTGFIEIVIGLDGVTTHYCNEREIRLGEGKIGYISEGGKHWLANRSSKPTAFLSIVHSVIPKPLKEVSMSGDIVLTEVAKAINLDSIVEKLSQSVQMTVTLIDEAGNFLTDKDNLPEICQSCLDEKSGDCVLHEATERQAYAGQRIFHCKFGVSAIQSPFIVNGKVLGYLGCGYGRMSTNLTQLVPENFAVNSAQEAYFKLNFIHRNHLNSVAETLSLVSASLVQLMIDSMKEKELSYYRINLVQEREMQARLHHSLSQARLKFLESQVNPHFLFNTLNTISQQAEMDGATTLASLTYSLSNLLRLSLGKAESLVTIEEELSYVRDYLFIQQTRFPDKFAVAIDIEPAMLEVKIPFMTIMVLIENSILHGFKDVAQQGQLLVRAYKEDNCGIIEVHDNGCGIAKHIGAAVRELSGDDYDPPSLKGIGIKNIFLRLKHYYGDMFTFTIERLEAGGTLARIVLRL